MSTDYVSLVREAESMRGRIRQAADDGDLDEVIRLLRRCRELEDDAFAVRYVQVRHQRATDRRARWGYSSTLDSLESELSDRLARIGVVHHTRT
jgi:hypothetical protein